MAKIFLHLTIIFLMIAGCIGTKGKSSVWSEAMDQRLLDIFYGLYPPNQHFWENVKREWDSQLPKYNGLSSEILEGHVCELIFRYCKIWQQRPGAEREMVEDVIAHIYAETKNNQPNHEMRLLNTFLRYFPQYGKDLELIRTVVYRWYERYAPLGKEITAKDVDWTPQRMANLLHIADQVRVGVGHLHGRIKQRWSEIYKYLNVNGESLLRYVQRLKNKDKYEPTMEEKFEAERTYEKFFPPEVEEALNDVFIHRGQRQYWTDKMNADLMYIHAMVRPLKNNVGAALKNRWDRMYPKLTHLSQKTLQTRVTRLENLNYKPKPDHCQKAKIRYEALPPIPQEFFSKRTERRRIRPLRIREGHVPNQQHQDVPACPSAALTSENLKSLRQDSKEISASYAGHAHYPYGTYYYGSSSHNPFDQIHFASLPDTPHPHQHFSNSGGSSSHTPIQQLPFGSLTNIQDPNQHFSNSGPSGSRNPIHQNPFNSLTNIPQSHQNFWSPGGSSNHTLIYEDPSGLIAVTSRPRSRQLYHNDGSNHTSVHQDSSRPQVDTPRPYRHQWFSGRDSRH